MDLKVYATLVLLLLKSSHFIDFLYELCSTNFFDLDINIKHIEQCWLQMIC